MHAVHIISETASRPMTIIAEAALSAGVDVVKPVLEAHIKASAHFRGIRDSTNYDPSGSPVIVSIHAAVFRTKPVVS